VAGALHGVAGRRGWRRYSTGGVARGLGSGRLGAGLGWSSRVCPCAGRGLGEELLAAALMALMAMGKNGRFKGKEGEESNMHGRETGVGSALVLHKQEMRTDGNIRTEETMTCCTGTSEQQNDCSRCRRESALREGPTCKCERVTCWLWAD
jgi:hypothetical protein